MARTQAELAMDKKQGKVAVMAFQAVLKAGGYMPDARRGVDQGATITNNNVIGTELLLQLIDKVLDRTDRG